VKESAMSTLLESAPNIDPPRLRLTIAQVAALYNNGLIDDHWELLNGELRRKMSINEPPMLANGLCYDALTQIFGTGFVRVPGPIALNNENAPEPDVAVTKQPRRVYTSLPPASEVVLVVEISDSTLRYDRTEKALLYAEGGITEYWIVNLPERCLLVHRQPGADGFGSLTTLTEIDTVSPLAAPSAVIAVKDLLP
jgi:Uma2 family endonuclease